MFTADSNSGDDSGKEFRSTSTAPREVNPYQPGTRKLSERPRDPLTLRTLPRELISIEPDVRAAFNVHNAERRVDAKALKLGFFAMHKQGLIYLSSENGSAEIVRLYPIDIPSDRELADILLRAPDNWAPGPPYKHGWAAYANALSEEDHAKPKAERRKPISTLQFGCAYLLWAEADKFDFSDIRYQFIVRRDGGVWGQPVEDTHRAPA